MEIIRLEQIGTKPTDAWTITLDHDPEEYAVFALSEGTKHVKKGSVWVVRGEDYSYDEKKTYIVLRRVDSETV